MEGFGSVRQKCLAYSWSDGRWFDKGGMREGNGRDVLVEVVLNGWKLLMPLSVS